MSHTNLLFKIICGHSFHVLIILFVAQNIYYCTKYIRAACMDLICVKMHLFIQFIHYPKWILFKTNFLVPRAYTGYQRYFADQYPAIRVPFTSDVFVCVEKPGLKSSEPKRISLGLHCDTGALISFWGKDQ